MDLENDTWEVINSYFRDIPNNLVRHHIDSYNDFIQNKIPQILANTSKNPPIILIDKEYFRPNEVEYLKGNAAKAKKKLKWNPKINIHQLIHEMMTEDQKSLKKTIFNIN